MALPWLSVRLCAHGPPGAARRGEPGRASRQVDSVCTDDIFGVGLAVRNLVILGHCRIVHIDGGRDPSGPPRRHGYELAMRDQGLAALVVPGDFSERRGRRRRTDPAPAPPARGRSGRQRPGSIGGHGAVPGCRAGRPRGDVGRLRQHRPGRPAPDQPHHANQPGRTWPLAPPPPCVQLIEGERTWSRWPTPHPDPGRGAGRPGWPLS